MSQLERLLSVVLQAHVPLAKPGFEAHESARFFELCERGLLPLIEWLDTEERAQSGPVLTLAISPSVLSMLAEPGMPSRLDAHLEEHVAVAHREARRTDKAGHTGFHVLAASARESALERLEWFREALSSDLLGALDRCRRSGRLALIPSAGTHAILPLVESYALRALHVAAACADFHEHFGERPTGFWLPECCWADGLDDVLAGRHIKWTVAAANAVRPIVGAPDSDALTPLLTPRGVAVFPESSALRNALIGAGGALEDPAFAAPGPSASALPTYFARGDGGLRPPYDFSSALEHAERLGDDLVAGLLRRDGADAGLPTVLALPLESVGPGWAEGIAVVRAVIEAARRAGLTVRPPSTSDIPVEAPRAEPLAATWLSDGYFTPWVDEDVAWMYRGVGRLTAALRDVEPALPRASRSWRQAYAQAVRELLCAQSSDWPAAVMGGRGTREAISRFEDHVTAGLRITHMLASRQIEDDYVIDRGTRRPIFNELDTLVSQGVLGSGRV